MRIRSVLLAAGLLPASLLSVAAVDADDCTQIAPDTTGCAATLWLSGCDRTETGKVYHQVVHGTVPLSETPPTGSYTAGDGCGTYEEPVFSGARTGNPYYDLTTAGYAEIDNPGSLTVELHDIYASRARANQIVKLAVKVEVDGVSLFGSEEVPLVDGTTETAARAIQIDVPTVRSATGASELLAFTIVDIAKHFPELFEEDGTGAGYTDVTVSVSVLDPGGHVFVWGAEEIASNVRFNGAPAPLRIEASTGRPRR